MQQLIEIYAKHGSNVELKEQIFGKLKKDGRHYKTTCPSCSNQNCQVSSDEPLYYCFACGAKGNYVGAIKEIHKVEFKEAVKILCDLVNESSDFLNQSNQEAFNNVEQEIKKKRKNDELEMSFLLTSALEKSQQALSYLVDVRKFSEAEIKAARLGLVTKANLKKINEILSANNQQQLSDYYLNRIAIPTDNNLFNAFSSYIFRTFDKSEQIKYLQFPGSDKSNLFSLARGKDKDFRHLVVVEGILEALIQNVRDKSRHKKYWWLGIGGVDLAQKWEQIDFLLSNENLESCTILLDNDKVGINTSLALTPEVVKAMSSKLKNALFFWDWKKVNVPYKDTLDLLAESNYSYDDLISDIDEKQYEKSLWEQIVTICFWESELNGKDFLPINHVHLTEGLKKFEKFVNALDAKDLPNLKATLEKRFKKEESILKDLLAKLEEFSTQKSEAEFLVKYQEWGNQIANAKTLLELEKLKEKSPVADKSFSEEEVTEKILDYYSSEISFVCPTFYSELDKITGFTPGGLHLVAASTGGGKTAFMLNLLRLQLQHSNEKCLFISIEETGMQLLKKLVFSVANTLITPVEYASGNITKFAYYVKEQRKVKPNQKLEEAINFVENKRESNQLKILYKDNFFVEDFEQECAFYADKGYKFFFIDYIQKIRSKNGKLEGYLLGKRIGEILSAVARKYGVVLISGCQFNRAPGQRFDKIGTIDDIRESADFANNSTLLIGLSSISAESAEDERSQSILYLNILKNRYGSIGDKLEYYFFKPTCHISEEFTPLANLI